MNFSKRVREANVLWFAVVSLLVFSLCACQPQAPKHPNPEPYQDSLTAYNYERIKNGKADFVYAQYWYFNFLDDKGDTDASNDVAGVGAFGIANPENLFFQKGVVAGYGMIIRPAQEGTSFGMFGPFLNPAEPGNFSGSKTFESGQFSLVQCPFGKVDVISPDEYHTVGQVDEGARHIQWDLTYKRTLGPGWLCWQEWPLPATLWVFPAWVNYYMPMPNASVNGTFRVQDGADDKTYTLSNAKGYHDGFFGKYVFSLIRADWMDYKQDDPPLAIQLMSSHGLYTCQGGWDPCSPGVMRVVYNGAEYVFPRKAIEITYDQKAYDDKYKVYYPTQETIKARDPEGNMLEVHWTDVIHLMVYYPMPKPYKSTVSSEIIANVRGTFYEAKSKTTVPILGSGWTDWVSEAFADKR